MSDQNEQDPKKQSEQQQPDLFGELQALGRQMEQTVRGLVDHERVRSFQRDFFSGVNELATQMQSAFKTLQENPQVKEWSERGQQAMNQAQQSDAVKDFQQTVARGMANLNQQINAFGQRMQNQSPGESPGVQNQPPGDTTETASESGPTPPPAGDAGEQQPGAAASPDFTEEMNKLRQNLEQTGRGVMDNERAQTMQRDITNGIQQFLTQAQKSMQAMQDNPQVKDWSERGQQAMNQAQQHQVVRDFQQTMANSLAYFNQQLAELRTRQQKQEEASGSSSHSVPIDIEDDTTDAAPRSAHSDPADAASGPATGVPGTSGTPATGPTQRLDPDRSEQGSVQPSAPAQPAQQVPIDSEENAADTQGTGEDNTPRSAHSDPADAASGPATGIPGTSGTPATGPTQRLDPEDDDEGGNKPQQ
jgi:hypothetical protein